MTASLGRTTTAVEEAAANWLRAQVAAGPRPAAELLAAARAIGIKERTLRAARQALAVEARFTGFGASGIGCGNHPRWRKSQMLLPQMTRPDDASRCPCKQCKQCNQFMDSGLTPPRPVRQ